MKIKKQKKKMVTETTFHICDRCKGKYGVDDIEEVQEFLHVDFVGGYGSIFGDGTRVQCDLCQICLYALIKDYARTEEVH